MAFAAWVSLADFRAASQGFFATLRPWKPELASLLTGRFQMIGHNPTQISPA